MARLARELKVHIVAGSITEHIEGQEKTYNTSVMLGPDGAQDGRLSQDSSVRHRFARPRDGEGIGLAASPAPRWYA